MRKQVRFPIIIFIVAGFITMNLSGQLNYPPEIKSSKVEIYKSIDDIDLNLWIFNPQNHKISDKKTSHSFLFWRRMEVRLTYTVYSPVPISCRSWNGCHYSRLQGFE